MTIYAFVYPKEGTNKFVDVMCIPSSSENKKAAELFINYMCEPEVALHNANYLAISAPLRLFSATTGMHIRITRCSTPSRK